MGLWLHDSAASGVDMGTTWRLLPSSLGYQDGTVTVAWLVQLIEPPGQQYVGLLRRTAAMEAFVNSV